MNQESHSKEPTNRSDVSTDQKSSEARSKERAEGSKDLEKVSKELFERFRDFLCGDSSQRATGQRSLAMLKDRASRSNPEFAPFNLGNDPLSGTEAKSNEKTAEFEKILELDFGVVDLVDSSDFSHLSYNHFHVEYHCDTGEISVKTPEGFLEAYEKLKGGALQKWAERIEFISEPHKAIEHIRSFFSELKEESMEPTESSEKADLTAESIREQKLLDSNSFTRGFADWPTFRSERIATSDRGNTVCNMPDFKSPGIDRTFK